MYSEMANSLKDCQFHRIDTFGRLSSISKSDDFQYDTCKQILPCVLLLAYFKQKTKLAEKLKAAVASSL
jgi:hypothetical protein